MGSARTNVNLDLAPNERLSLVTTGRQLRALIDAAHRSRGEEPEFASEPVSNFALRELHRCLEFVQDVQDGKRPRKKEETDGQS